jgi:hypothetical protein
VFGWLINDEESEELCRKLADGLVGFFGREIVPEDRVFVVPGVILANEFQSVLHYVDSPPFQTLG